MADTSALKKGFEALIAQQLKVRVLVGPTREEAQWIDVPVEIDPTNDKENRNAKG